MFKADVKIGTVVTALALLMTLILCTSAAGPFNSRTTLRNLATELAPGTALTGLTAATETAVGFTGLGSQTIPIIRLNKIGARVPFKFCFISTSDDDATETLEMRIRLGGLTGEELLDTGALIIGAASHTAIPWTVNGEVVTITTGATGTGYAAGTYTYQLGAAAPVTKTFYHAISSLNYTTTKDLIATAIFAATPDGGDTVQQVQCSIDHVNYN